MCLNILCVVRQSAEYLFKEIHNSNREQYQQMKRKMKEYGRDEEHSQQKSDNQ